MELNKNNIKKILGIITFTLVLLSLLMNFGKVQSFLAFLWGILFPFVLTGLGVKAGCLFVCFLFFP